MLFCPKCGAILTPKKAGNKTTLSCSCGFSTKETDKATISEEVKDKGKEVEVVEKDFEAFQYFYEFRTSSIL